MNRTQRNQREPEEWIWPASREKDEWAAPPNAAPPYVGRGVPAWMDAPTDPNIHVKPKNIRRAKSPPEWPGPARPAVGERLLRRAESGQFSVGCGSTALLLLIGAFLLAALTTGIPFFGGNSSPNGVQANPLATATTMPTATATHVPTPTPTLAPTATAVPTIAPVPSATPAPDMTPWPAATPTPRKHRRPTPTAPSQRTPSPDG
jgi:hypothetical protein